MEQPVLTEEVKRTIDAMSQYDMAGAWRFAPAGSIYFVTGPVFYYFKKSFEEKGGMTPAISKAVGWDRDR